MCFILFQKLNFLRRKPGIFTQAVRLPAATMAPEAPNAQESLSVMLWPPLRQTLRLTGPRWERLTGMAWDQWAMGHGFVRWYDWHFWGKQPIRFGTVTRILHQDCHVKGEKWFWTVDFFGLFGCSIGLLYVVQTYMFATVVLHPSEWNHLLTCASPKMNPNLSRLNWPHSSNMK